MIQHKLSIPNLKKEDERKISEALHDVWGVRNVKMNTQTNEAIISYDEDAGSLQDFQQAVIDMGYEANTNEEEI
ncbi:heavy-metal-associated domain-containing protein [Virgibacillus sp. MSP4-1]|uniref:heavy-metal-associated domain-containing protein n=1 Tax=Virgibacillus sp. MSP4-1 TaxID=2700081 RepID=UPI0003A1564C|nr:heavy metal-associated domain-containing protein [Virgibacillus sp. MSP4-1]QHS22379.1 heavy-metal-associated domain-containing protein [Virgibacillus sp. MSP4-1]